ncbi:hypothetical protein [Halobacterium rubrum]|uniref:hypothetical protein n=1 Tax=Halobacterium TaxID=2239 RepID=UPI001F1E7458|nr:MULTISPECIES: hypothetical protein [Halobacterium]MDH5018892.1 hypothetical protein [Halobacterium rubrum]
MNKLKLASIVLAAVASTGLVFGSVGFSAVAADRGVSVSVASDDEALVGYESETVDVTGTERVALVTVENRLPSDASVTNVTVTTGDDDVTVSKVSKPEIGTGDKEPIEADIHCHGNEDVSITVSVTVEGEGVTAAISGDTRSFELDCGGSGQEPGPQFNGAGNFEFGATDAETVNVTYWTETKAEGGSSSDFTENGSVEVDPTAKLNSQVEGGPKFVAVYVEERNKTYFNPKFVTGSNETVVDGKQNPDDR